MLSITAVGATQGAPTETAATFSSGGFSDIFPIPSFQADAVADYHELIGDMYPGLWNSSGRGFPDVAMNGVDFNIILNRELVFVYGTSCSAPTVAAVIGLIDAELDAKNMPALGWLNPFLYQHGSGGIVDIISGNNPGCDTDGFPAAPGWDPVCHPQS